MTVMIKGMKKPTVCYKCPLRTGKYCGILTENEKCADDGVLPHCPIAEVQTPHGRLIDADRVISDANYDITTLETVGTHKLSNVDKLRLMERTDILRGYLHRLVYAPTVIESEEE